ncbi:MAG: ATP-grasp domain-containing protein [Promethearchaeota archaeon]
MTDISVLFIPAGSGMAVSAIKSLRHCEDITTVAADSDQLAPGLFLADQGYLIPLFKSPNFFSSLRKIVQKEKIDVIIPCLDPLLELFTKDKLHIEELLGTRILMSPADTINITRDKWLTFQHLKNTLVFPQSWIELGCIPKNSFPLFVKPRKGSGSINTFVIQDRKELEFFFSYVKDPIVQEYLSGKEFTVDCLASPSGELITVIPRERIQTKSGISTKAMFIEELEPFLQMAQIITEKLHLIGPFFFQLKENAEKILNVMEINARLSGTMIFSILSGFNIIEEAIRQFVEGKMSINTTELKSKMFLPGRDFSYQHMFMSRYWEEIFVNPRDLKKAIE